MMEALNHHLSVQVINSYADWQQISTFRVQGWIRVLISCAGLALLLLTIIFSPIFFLLIFINELTLNKIVYLRGLKKRLKRLLEWSFVIAHSALITAINPRLSFIILTSYCYLRSYDIPNNWLKWILKWDVKRKNSSPI